MNLGHTRIVVRERGAAELVDLGCRLPFALGGELYLRLAALTVLPAAAVCAGAIWLELSRAWLWLLAGTCFALIQGPFTVAASKLMFSSSVTLRSVFAQFGRHALRYLLARLTALLLIGGGAAVVIALPVVLARALYLSEVVLLEGTGIGASYRRSMRLGPIGPALAAWSVLLGLVFGFVVCAHVLVEAVSANLLGLSAVSALWENGPCDLSSLGLLCAAPFVATARFLAYIDSRTRREAWEIQVDFTRLAAGLSRQP